MESPSDAYAYSPLNPALNEIRLLTLRPDFPGSELNIRLETASLDSDPEYEALSYVWGTSELTCSCWIKGKSRRITPNLEIALQHLRSTENGRKLWIDGLCINQDDNKEKGQQVQMMSQIYQKASRVIVWLRKKDYMIDKAFNFLEKWMAGGIQLHISEEEFSGIEKVFQKSEWWSRLWVVQELYFAKEASITCGDRSVSWEIMNKLMVRLVAGATETDRRLAAAMRPALALAMWSKINMIQLHNKLDRFQNIMEILSAKRKCSDKRDVIYALVGLVPLAADQPQIVVDYGKPVEDVYMEFTRNMLAYKGKLSLLCDTYEPYSEEGVNYQRGWDKDWTPYAGTNDNWVRRQSWSINWSRPREPESLINPHPANIGDLYSAAGDALIGKRLFHPDNPNVLVLNGVLFDTIASITDHWYDFEGWQALVRKWSPENLEQMVYPTGEDATDAFIRTLLRDVARHSTGMPNERMPKQLFFEFKKQYLAWLTDGDDSFFDPVKPPTTASPALSRSEFAFFLGSSTIGWRFFVTEKGYFGLAQRHARVGDRVCVVDGACTPLVLRQASEDVKEAFSPELSVVWVRVSAAYVHGIMDGEVGGAVERGELGKEEVLLV